MRQIGHYEILDELGRGGMGVVYRARDPRAQRVVALKVLRVDPGTRPVQLNRFERESQALARVRHPNVVGVHEAGVDDASGLRFMALEYVEGQALDALVVREGPLAPERAASLVAQAAAGLEAAHAAGVIHRDVKPANVLLDTEGRVRVTDFGLVRNLDAGLDATRLSQTGVFLGTPGYWSPEQARGLHDQVDARTDVYGLGATLFELLTGSAPEKGPSLAACMDRLLDPPRAPSTLRPDVPADLDAIVLRCLCRDPAGRYPSAAALAEDLGRFGAGLPIAATRRARPWRWVGLVGGALLIGLVAAWASASRAPPATFAPAAPASAPPATGPTPTPTPIPPFQAILGAARALAADPGPTSLAAFEQVLLERYDPADTALRWAAVRDEFDGRQLHQRVAARLVEAISAPTDELAGAWRAYSDSALESSQRIDDELVMRIQDWEQEAASDPSIWVIDTYSLGRKLVDGGVGHQLLLRRLQQRAFLGLYEPWIATAGGPSLFELRLRSQERDRKLGEFSPASRPARRVRLFETFLASPGHSALPVVTEDVDADPLLALMQRLANHAQGFGPFPSAAVLALDDELRPEPGRTTDSRDQVFCEVLRNYVSRFPAWGAYAEARAAGHALTEDAIARHLDQLGALWRVLERRQEVLGELVDPRRRAMAQAALILVGPRPEDALAEDLGPMYPLFQAEVLLAQGRYGDLSQLEGIPLRMVGLARHLHALSRGRYDLGVREQAPDDFDPLFPWHGPPYAEGVIAGEVWWPGAP